MKTIIEMFHKPITHRGLHDSGVDENSLSAFDRSIKAGLGFELDIHMLADGTIVVHHDETIKRLTGVDKRLDQMTLSELKKYPLLISGELIPTFEEVLKLTMGRVPILVELKISNSFDPSFTTALLKVLEAYPYKDMIALQSFNPYAVRWLKANTNDYLVGQLSSPNLSGQKLHVRFLFKTLLINKISHPDFVSYDIEYLPSCYVSRLRKKGMPIIAWTIDDHRKQAKALLYSDQYIFEKISL